MRVPCSPCGPGEDARPPTPDLWRQELDRKGDHLDYDGLRLRLLSGETVLSEVAITGGGHPVLWLQKRFPDISWLIAADKEHWEVYLR